MTLKVTTKLFFGNNIGHTRLLQVGIIRQSKFRFRAEISGEPCVNDPCWKHFGTLAHTFDLMQYGRICDSTTLLLRVGILHTI